ncbi:MAG: hypothetical protein QGI78_05040 [Phycisphaerales bacterium]|jgi:hypothetical protein|nr:hypothetical protein [Phycisphaerales bacterium]
MFKAISELWSGRHEELFEAGTHDAIRLRMHRAFSWMRKAQGFEVPEDADAKLIFSWIGLNTLYAKWDSNIDNRQPEWQVREEFLRWMVQQDATGRVQQVLLDNRKHCDRLLSEEHLINSYWGNPTEEEARKARTKPRKIGKHYHDSDEVIKVLIPLIKCVAMLRSQLVHGQSTYGSSANREVVEAGAKVMFDLVMTLLQIVAEDGLWEDDSVWQPVPYPPMKPHFRRDS